MEFHWWYFVWKKSFAVMVKCKAMNNDAVSRAMAEGDLQREFEARFAEWN